MEIPPERLKKLDPDMNFIFNINTPADLEKAREISGKRPPVNVGHIQG
jgi:molybdopterin-guanine dinucleotide biosynthesis protein A